MHAHFNSFSIEMTLREALAMSWPGNDVDGIVGLFVKQPRFQNQFKKIPTEDIQKELREYGAWNEGQLLDFRSNEKRILWIAACNIREEQSIHKKDKGT